MENVAFDMAAPDADAIGPGPLTDRRNRMNVPEPILLL